MRRFSALFFALAFCASAHAQWTIISTQSEFSAEHRVEYRHVLARSEAGDEATIELAIFSPKSATLRVIDNQGANDSLGAVMQREKCIAGVNGGYFDPEYAPVGLMISDGRLVSRQQKARLLSAVVSATNDRVLVQRASEFSIKTKPIAARQCGPFLVDHGKAIPALNDYRTAPRTFVATVAGERAAIGYCSPVTLAQLAVLLATPDLRIQRAMNLDGGSSSAFWFKRANGSAFSIGEQKPVRDFVAVVPR